MTLTITTDEIYSRTGFDNDDLAPGDTIVNEATVTALIALAKSFVEDKILETKLDETDKTEYLYGNNKDWLYLNYTPVTSLTSLTINSTAVTTTKVFLDSLNGKIILKSDSSPEVANFNKNYNYPSITVVYKYGYTDATRPVWAAELVREFASILTLIVQMGGTFDDLSTSSIGDFSWTVGQAYVNIKGTIDSKWTMFKYLTEAHVVKKICCVIPDS